MALVNQPIGRREKIWIAKESAFGVFPTPFLGSHTVRLQDAVSIRRVIDIKPRMDKGDNASPSGRDAFMRKVEVSFPESYFRPSGVLATAPEMDALLEVALGVKHAASLSTTISASTTNKSMTPASITGLQVGDVVGFSGGNVSATGEFDVVDTLPGGGVITLKNGLSVTPNTSVAMRHGITYRPTAILSSTLALLRSLQNRAETWPALCIEEMRIKLAADEWFKAAFTGMGSGSRVLVGSSKAVGAGAPGTALTLTTGEGRLFDLADGAGYISIAGGAAVQAASLAGDVLTIGSSTWANDDEITPGLPSRTYVGSPVTGILGRVYWMDGTTQRTLSLENAEILVKNNLKDQREYGNNKAFGYFRGEPHRNTTLNAQVRGTRLQQLLDYMARSDSDVPFVAQAGTASGSTIAIVIPKLHLDPDLNMAVPAAGEVMMPITGTALSPDNDTDGEIYVGLL